MNIKDLNYKKEIILKKIRNISNFMRGSVYNTAYKCGKKTCWCYKSSGKHPACMLTLHIGGKQLSISIPENKRDEILQLTKEYKRLWNLIDNLTQINIKILKVSHKIKRRGG